MDDAELRAALARDREDATRARSAVAIIVRSLGAIAVVVAGYLLWLAYQFHTTMDAIIGIPFVFGCVIGALFVGMPGLYMLVTGRVTGMPNPLTFF